MSPTILSFKGMSPKIHDSAFVAPTACVIGDVEIGEDSSIWYGCTVRGDVNYVRIGKNTNLQDNSVIHVDHHSYPTVIGDNILIGHQCIIHACTLEDDCFIGMQACVMDGATVERHAMVAAGALVVPGKVVKSGELWGGRPAQKLRDLTKEEIANFRIASDRYAEYAREHKTELTTGGKG